MQRGIVRKNRNHNRNAALSAPEKGPLDCTVAMASRAVLREMAVGFERRRRERRRFGWKQGGGAGGGRRSGQVLSPHQYFGILSNEHLDEELVASAELVS